MSPPQATSIPFRTGVHRATRVLLARSWTPSRFLRLSTVAVAFAILQNACGGSGDKCPVSAPSCSGGNSNAPTCSVTAVTVSPINPTVTVRATVTLSANVTQTGCSPIPVAVWSSADAGVASVSAATGVVTGVSPGTTTISANANGKVGATAVTVTAPIPTRLTMVTQPSASAPSGVALPAQPVVQLADLSGNAVSVAGVTVTANISSGGGLLGGTTSVVTNASGQAAFTNLKLNGLVGPRTLIFASAGLTSVTSSAITLTPGLSASLAFATQPTTTPVASAIAPAIAVVVRDVDGNTVTSETNTVTLSITPGTGAAGAALSGLGAVVAVQGVATFSGLSVNAIGIAYRLTATSGALASAASSTFDVTPSLLSVNPASVDAVFAVVPFLLTGNGMVSGGTNIRVTGGQLTATNVSVQSAIAASGVFSINGGIATSVQNVSYTTALGTSNALSIETASVGGATLRLGASNGGSGGSPFTLDCPTGAIATGLNVRSGNSVDQIQVICQTVTGANRAFGSATFTDTAGGTGGSPATVTCPANYVMVGVTGRIGNGGSDFNDQIAAVCAPIVGGATVTTASLGGVIAGSIAYTTTCPAGLAVTGIQGSSGVYVDRTQIKCR